MPEVLGLLSTQHIQSIYLVKYKVYFRGSFCEDKREDKIHAEDMMYCVFVFLKTFQSRQSRKENKRHTLRKV